MNSGYKTLAAGALVLIISTGNVLAQEYNCKEPQFQQEMNFCSARDFDDADRVLNTNYRKAVALMKSMDRDLDAGQKGAEEALRKGQRAWVTYRDKACEAEGYIFHGGTMETMIYNGCRTRLTKQRATDLRDLVENY